MKITKEQLDTFDKTQKQYELERTSINNRFDEVIKTIADSFNARVDWYDFDNGDSEIDGYFDSELYKNEISYIGKFHLKNSVLRCESMNIVLNNGEVCYLMNCFPTRWLYEDFIDELTQGQTKYIAVKQQQIKDQLEQEVKKKRKQYLKLKEELGE